MATGIQSGSSKNTVVVRLVDAASVANGAPDDTAAFSGVGLPVPLINGKGPTYGSIRVHNPAGVGGVGVTYVRLWGGQRDPDGDDATDKGKWFPGGTGTNADKGKINNGQALGETSTNRLRHAEPVTLPGHCDRVYAELGTVSGSALVAAGLALGTLAAGALNTQVTAVVPGSAGNNITVKAIGDSPSGVTINEVGNAVTIHFQTLVSTVANVETALAGATLIAVLVPGTGATVLNAATDGFAPTNLTAGTDLTRITVDLVLARHPDFETA